jgi:eukaryotic-like serine/threonine-protein kinase
VRFRNEASLAARLAHPNVVGALDYGCHSGSWYYAMEFVDGRPLSDLLAEHRRVSRPLPPRVVASLIAQVASALRHAHEIATDDDGTPLRVVHRDLSPSNVLVDRTGRAHLADFGVARALYDADAATTKVLTGKPSYVAPETLRDGVIDPRIDLWSLGVILWEALTNRRLFARDSEAASMVAVVEAEIPRPTSLRPELDLRWDVLVEKLLARNPEHRHGTASELLEDLQDLAVTEGSVTPADLAALLAPEDGFDELPLENTADESGGQRGRRPTLP